MDILQLDQRPDNWDALIRDYDTCTLFHETAWLGHIQSIHPRGKLVWFAIRDNGEPLGYLCAQQIRKAFLHIYGSPLGGTGTNYMGPLVNEDTDQPALAVALRKLVLGTPVSHFEFANDWLQPDIMKSTGFEVHPGVTHVLELPPDEGKAWNQLKSTCRNRIRKGEKNRLQVEVAGDLSLADEYYDQFVEVYAKQGMVTPFDRERPRSLLKHLLPAGRILPLRVTHDGEVVATGLFPFDEKCIYFWGAASWLRHHKLCPNELLHWTVIKHAIARGIPEYNMCGGMNPFKDKFGGADVPYIHYSLSSLPMMKHARRLYRSTHFAKLQAAGWLRRLRARRT